MMKSKLLMGAFACLCAWGAQAAESNAVSVDLQSDVVRYLDSGTLSFPLPWEGGLVPAGVTEATLKVTGKYCNISETVSKPAPTISCTLFEEPPVPFRSDTLTARLIFSSADGKLAVTNSVTYELRAASFGRGRVLTCPTTANAWRLYQPPADIPFDRKWYPENQGANLTWMSCTNLVTGANTQKTGMAPLNGEGAQCGYVSMEKEVYPSGKYYLKIYSGNALRADAWLDGVNGVMIIVR